MQSKQAISKLFLLLFGVAVFSSCNNFEKLLKNPDYGLKYREGNRYYGMKKYDKAVALYENVMPFYRNTPQDDTLTVQTARSYYHMRDYEMSEYYFNAFRRQFPRSGFIEEVDFYGAMSLFNQSQRSELDQTQTKQAIQAFNTFERKYPRSSRIDTTQLLLNELAGKLDEKAYLSAKLYYKTEHYRAAVVALKNCMKDYPESKYKEELMFLVLKSTYLHAVHSIKDKQRDRFQQAVDEYFNLASEFPVSKYKKEADKIYRDSLEATKS
ncbi:MAG: outer membrane protein assembly factor BamD [Prevotellaceae bacterium]|nr:outer membrane protein assembly factor BamD [Prevotellaceae bacterium]